MPNLGLVEIVMIFLFLILVVGLVVFLAARLGTRRRR